MILAIDQQGRHHALTKYAPGYLSYSPVDNVKRNEKRDNSKGRAAYELSRLLVALPSVDHTVYAIPTALQTPPIAALFIHTHSITRTTLELALVAPGTTLHLIPSSARALAPRLPPSPHTKYVTSINTDLAPALAALPHPTLLVLYDAQKTLDILQSHNISTHQWSDDLRDYFSFGTYAPSSHRDRPPSPRPPMRKDKVYYVDVKAMYQSLARTDVFEFIWAYRGIFPNTPEEGREISALRDAKRLLEMWRSMAEGPHMEKRRIEVEKRPALRLNQQPSKVAKSDNEEEDDEESDFDPNEAPVRTTTATTTASEPKGKVGYSDAIEDDHSDYGTDDSD